MAHSASAKRRMRSDAKKFARNSARKATLATFEKSLNKAIEAKELDQAQDTLKTIFSKYDKAVKAGVIKRETASRKKSRLTLRVNKALAAK